jgi:hypothetical protein
LAKAYYIPNGPANLATLFPAIDFSQVAEYYVEILDNGGTLVATTPMNQICGCEDCEDMIRIFFQNGAGGAIDAVNFKIIEKNHEAKSDAYQKPTQYPLEKTDHAINRFNVKSNTTYKAVTIDYNEQHFDWLEELFDAPLAWIYQAAIQGQVATYVPVVILDKVFPKQKQEDRFTYQVEIEFKLSHEKFIIRN